MEDVCQPGEDVAGKDGVAGSGEEQEVPKEHGETGFRRSRYQAPRRCPWSPKEVRHGGQSAPPSRAVEGDPSDEKDMPTVSASQETDYGDIGFVDGAELELLRRETEYLEEDDFWADAAKLL